MIYSMTAFGRSQTRSDWGLAIWELRSVNHRYLEMTIRLPEILRELEPTIRETIHQFFQRGKIECVLRFYPGPNLSPKININNSLLQQLVNVINEISSQLPADLIRVNPYDFLSWEGVIVEEAFDLNLIRSELLELFKNAAIDLKEGRRREGAVLAEAIEERLKVISYQVKVVAKQLPKIVDRQREKILQRLEEVKNNFDALRLEQEMVYYSQKIDIAEEIDRARSHLAEVKRTLKKDDSAGRRLDFMMQELNREANTIASKSTDAIISHAAVEMKVLIEQIREQVQNIE